MGSWFLNKPSVRHAHAHCTHTQTMRAGEASAEDEFVGELRFHERAERRPWKDVLYRVVRTNEVCSVSHCRRGVSGWMRGLLQAFFAIVLGSGSSGIRVAAFKKLFERNRDGEQ